MKISVIVSTYNHPSYLTLVLDSLKNQVNAGEYEIVIADDGSGTPVHDNNPHYQTGSDSGSP